MNAKIERQIEQRKRRIEQRLDKKDCRGCDRPAMTAANVRYEIASRTTATAHGGIGAMHMLAQRLGLPQAIDERLGVLKLHLPYHDSDHVLNIAYNLLSGGTCLEHLERLHGLSQAIQKRGLPRALLTDNGAAMIAEEVTEGLLRLGIVHEKTLPYSPYQNGKQECFWASLEGRLMEMLGEVRELSLAFLNEATQAWVEIEYNRRAHREIACSPVQRFSQASDVLRASPSSAALRDAFRMEGSRTQRQSDGTISVEGVRLEIPARYRHFRKVAVRYARWDLSRVDLVDPRSGAILSPLYPLDRKANADGQRLLFEPDGAAMPADAGARPDEGSPDQHLPPLLKQILAQYAARGLPPAYLPKNPPATPGETP